MFLPEADKVAKDTNNNFYKHRRAVNHEVQVLNVINSPSTGRYDGNQSSRNNKLKTGNRTGMSTIPSTASPMPNRRSRDKKLPKLNEYYANGDIQENNITPKQINTSPTTASLGKKPRIKGNI
jgi:hypothetical protein